MRLHPAWGFVLFLLAMLAADSLASAADIPNTHEQRTLEGFTVYVNKNVLARHNDGFGPAPRRARKELNDLKRILKPKIVGVLQSVPIWAEWDKTDKLSPGGIGPLLRRAGEGLLKLGGDPAKPLRRSTHAGAAAEIRRPGAEIQQIIILHEMAHVVHHRLLGWENPELQATSVGHRPETV